MDIETQNKIIEKAREIKSCGWDNDDCSFCKYAGHCIYTNPNIFTEEMHPICKEKCDECNLYCKENKKCSLTNKLPEDWKLPEIANTGTEKIATTNSNDNEPKEMVNHPEHYQGNKFEVIDIIEDYNLGFCLGNAIKYILRSGKKDETKQEIKKAIWYLKRYLKEIKKREKKEKKRKEQLMPIDKNF